MKTLSWALRALAVAAVVIFLIALIHFHERLTIGGSNGFAIDMSILVIVAAVVAIASVVTSYFTMKTWKEIQRLKTLQKFDRRQGDRRRSDRALNT